MKRFLTGMVAAVALAASQAAAGANGPLVHMADRAGPESATANEMFGTPLPVLLLALGIIVAFVVVANNDDGPSSP
jgi:hypothetical protein